jgi:hydroxyacylglutathione hydrolase
MRRTVAVAVMMACAAASALSCAHGASSSANPIGDRVAPGTLPERMYAGGAACTGTPRMLVHAYNADLFILRQPACTNYEKPFLYLLFGDERALLFDTGAGNIDVAFSVDSLLQAWRARHGGRPITLVVTHSHGHGDHVAGDSVFRGKPGVTLVEKDTAAVRAFFGITRWPDDSATIDIGSRIIDVLPIPGHEPASIALYDRRTAILLTGDTFYPGRLYVRDTAAFSRSVHRLRTFADRHVISHILGTHIENSDVPGKDYVVGTKDQPTEHGLALSVANLHTLDSAMTSLRGRVVRTIFPDFTIWPQ